MTIMFLDHASEKAMILLFNVVKILWDAHIYTFMHVTLSLNTLDLEKEF